MHSLHKSLLLVSTALSLFSLAPSLKASLKQEEQLSSPASHRSALIADKDLLAFKNALDFIKHERQSYAPLQQLKEDEPRCFISYAWGVPEQEHLIHSLAGHLRDAGINVYLDIWHNTAGTGIAQFAELILDDKTDFVVLAGSRKLMEKYNSASSSTAERKLGNKTVYSVVKLELSMIGKRATGPIDTILPIVLEASHEEVLPKFLWNTVSVGFQNRQAYPLNCFNLLGRLYKLGTDDPFLNKAINYFKNPDDPNFSLSSPPILIKEDLSVIVSRLTDIKELQKHFFQGSLEITPDNYQILNKFTVSDALAFQSYDKGICLKKWKASLGLESLYDLLHSFKKIKSIKVQMEWDQEADIAESLARAIQFYEDLTELKIKDCRLTDKGFKKVLRSITHKDKLKVLDLRGSSLSAGQFDTIKQVFVNLTTFKKDERHDQALIKDMQGLAATFPEPQDQGPVLKRSGGGLLPEKKVEIIPKQDSNTISSNQPGLVRSVQIPTPVIARSLPDSLKTQDLTEIELSCGKISLAGKTVLNLNNKHIGVKGAEAIAENLKGNTTLTTLGLWNNSIVDAGACAIAESLKGNITLTELNLGSNIIREAGARAIAESLRGNTTLTTLYLGNNSIGEAGALAIAQGLKGNATLTTLALGSNSIGEAGALAIAQGLKGNTTLTTLDFYANRIGDAGAVAVAESLKGNTTLTTLNLGFNSIADAGAIAVAESFKGNTTLTTLDLRVNGIGEAAQRTIREILKNHPKLKIVF